jgi:hypothetical protein
VLADLVRRDLVPEVWVPSVKERANASAFVAARI